MLDRACFCVIFLVYGYTLCLVRYLFVISTSVIDCLGRFVPEMTYYGSSGTLNLAKLNSAVKLFLQLSFFGIFSLYKLDKSTEKCLVVLELGTDEEY